MPVLGRVALGAPPEQLAQPRLERGRRLAVAPARPAPRSSPRRSARAQARIGRSYIAARTAITSARGSSQCMRSRHASVCPAAGEQKR
jgi:hypothetical protein